MMGSNGILNHPRMGDAAVEAFKNFFVGDE